MRFLLDTNVCVRFLTGRSASATTRFKAEAGRMSLCSVVKAELLLGAHKSARVAQNLETLASFFADLPSLPFDDRAADIYGPIRAELERAGTPIGPNDLLIAAIALANDLTLVTHNTREFSRISGLRLEDWE